MNSHVRYMVILLPAMMSLGAPHNLRAGMENCRFALHWKPKFSATKTITSLCDNPATTTIEPNYSPNWNSTTSTPNPLPCTNYTTSGYAAGTIYIVIGRAGLEGVAAASFGIDDTPASPIPRKVCPMAPHTNITIPPRTAAITSRIVFSQRPKRQKDIRINPPW